MINNKTIRTAVVSKLLGNTLAGNNVFNAKITPNAINTLPCVCVYTVATQAESKDHVDPGFTVRRQLDIEVTVAATTGYADTLDDLVYDIKNTLFTDSTWYTEYDSVENYSESYSFDVDGEKPIATCILSIELLTTELQ